MPVDRESMRGNVLDAVDLIEVIGSGPGRAEQEHSVARKLVRLIPGERQSAQVVDEYADLIRGMVRSGVLKFEQYGPNELRLIAGPRFDEAMAVTKAGRAERMRAMLAAESDPMFYKLRMYRLLKLMAGQPGHSYRMPERKRGSATTWMARQIEGSGSLLQEATGRLFLDLLETLEGKGLAKYKLNGTSVRSVNLTPKGLRVFTRLWWLERGPDRAAFHAALEKL